MTLRHKGNQPRALFSAASAVSIPGCRRKKREASMLRTDEVSRKLFSRLDRAQSALVRVRNGVDYNTAAHVPKCVTSGFPGYRHTAMECHTCHSLHHSRHSHDLRLPCRRGLPANEVTVVVAYRFDRSVDRRKLLFLQVTCVPVLLMPICAQARRRRFEARAACNGGRGRHAREHRGVSRRGGARKADVTRKEEQR